MLAEHDMIWAKFKMKSKLWRGNMNDSSLKHSHKIHGSRFTLWEKHNQTFYVTRSRGPGVPRLVVYLYLSRLEKGHTANPRCTLLLDQFRHQRHQFRLQTERETKVCWSWVRIFNLPKNKSLPAWQFPPRTQVGERGGRVTVSESGLQTLRRTLIWACKLVPKSSSIHSIFLYNFSIL